MTTMKIVLNDLIVGKYDFCCLCLKPHNKDAVLLKDIVVIDNGFISIEDLLSCMLDYQFLLGMSPRSAVCNPCKTAAMDSYKFIQMCKNNNYQLKKTVDAISKSLPSPRFVNTSKSVYISVNTEELTSEAYCDNRKPSSCKTILKRFQALRNKQHKLHLEVTKKSETKHKNDNDINPSKRISKIQKHKRISLNDIRYSENNYKCKYCMKIFRCAPLLRQHYFSIHAAKKIKCPECPRSYSTISLLKGHMFNSHTPSICSKCGKTYNNRYSLEYHTRMHSGERPYQCHLCESRFITASRRTDHIKTHHTTSERLECEICENKFKNECSLKKHIKRLHSSKKE